MSDIHGNMLALQAVALDIEARGVDCVVNLGDCLYGPFDPRPVADFLIQRQWVTVAGNEDRILVSSNTKPLSQTARWTKGHLDRCHLDWVEDLPSICTIADRGIGFHGQPFDDSSYLLTHVEADGTVRSRARQEIEQILIRYEAALIGCGHDHTPRWVEVSGYRTIVNPGSVGCPAYSDNAPVNHVIEMGSPHARYAIVDLGDDRVVVSLIAVDYDWEAASQQAQDNGFPDWAQWIATGCC